MKSIQPEAHMNFVGILVMLVISFLFLILRFGLRVKLKQVPFLSDWLCLASEVLFIAYSAAILNHIFNVSEHGSFEPSKSLNGGQQTSVEEMKSFMLMGFIVQLLFISTISMVKFSILSFCWHLFSINDLYKRVLIGTIAVCVAWWITFVFVIVFQCRPVQAMWAELSPLDKCISPPGLLLAVELTNFFIDFALLVLPMFAVRQLNLNKRKMWSLLGIFLLGAAVCITSILRLAAIWKPPNVMLNYNVPLIFLYSTLQIGMAIVCSCLPTLGPFLSKGSSSTGPSGYNSFGNGQNSRSAYKMSDHNSSNNNEPWRDVQPGGSSRNWRMRDDQSGDSEEHPLDPLPTSKVGDAK